MYLDRGRVQTEGFDLDTHDLFKLQLLKNTVKSATLGPTIHANVDGMPVAEPLGKSAPLAALLCNIQDRVEYLKITQTHIAALNRQTRLDLFVLLSSDLHP